MNFEGEFEGKTVVITGATGVFGRALVKAFADQGAKLCLTDREMEPLQALLKEVSAAEGSFAHVCDLKDDQSLKSLVDAVGTAWGAPDILINNAGIYPSFFLLDMSNDDWDAIFDINLRAPFVLSRDFGTQMVRKGVKGSIINISSGASRKMRRTAVAYSTSKTAMDRLTKGFAVELAEYGIRANAVEPGFAAGSTVSALSDTHISRVLANIPLGRPSDGNDLGNAVLFLCSAAGSYITGATLSVDGGGSAGTLDVHQDKKHAL